MDGFLEDWDMRVIAYGRVNQENKIDKELKEQIADVIQFCDQRGDRVVDTVWECCSGSHIGDMLKASVEKCRNGEADGIAVSDVSRISRNMVDVTEAARDMEGFGGQFVMCG